MTKNIYFDYNSTMPLNPKIKQIMSSVFNFALNSSSLHHYGQFSRKILENARNVIKDNFNLKETHELIFTSGCTEANNLALYNFHNINKICSYMEHPSVINIIGKGNIPLDNSGNMNIDWINSYLIKNGDKKIMISMMYANNEIGTIQPIKKIIQLMKKYNFIFHCDITQAIGRINIDINNIDLITFSSHKFGGPLGSGALIYNKKFNLKSMIVGGGQEFRVRSGTQNIIAIHGMAASFQLIKIIKQKFFKIKEMQKYLEKSIKNIATASIIFGQRKNRLPNTSSIYMPNVNAETQLIFFDLHRILLSGGSACSTGKTNTVKMQIAMGYSLTIASSSVRVSLGPSNTIYDLDNFINLWRELYLHNKYNKNI